MYMYIWFAMTHLWESDLNLLGRFHVEWTKSCTETPPVVTLRSDAIFVGRPHHVGILVGAYSTGDADHFRPSDKKVMLLSIHAPRWMGGPEISFIFEDFNALWGHIPYTRGSSSLPLSRLQIWFLTGWIWPFFDNDIPNGYSQWIFPMDVPIWFPKVHQGPEDVLTGSGVEEGDPLSIQRTPKGSAGGPYPFGVTDFNGIFGWWISIQCEDVNIINYQVMEILYYKLILF